MMNRWSATHHWRERLDTWLAEQEAIQREADQHAALERARTMQQRRRQMEDEAYDLHQEITTHIKAMLAWPLARRTVQGTGTEAGSVVIYEPAQWRLSDVARLGQFRELMRRVSLGEPISPQEMRAVAHAGTVDSKNIPAISRDGAQACVITVEGAPTKEDEIIFLPKTVVP